MLGRRVVERLDAAGVGARVMSRSGRPGTVRGDLLTGEGLDAAVRGVETIIHCASSPFRQARRVDVEGTRRLLEAAGAGVSHLVYISIVGVDRASSYPYYRVKLETERVVEGSPVPHTILRATQFYDFVLMAVRSLDRLPVMPGPAKLLGQPIEVGEVAGRLAELALSRPAGRVPDVGGPEVGTLADSARRYLGVLGSPKRVIEIPASRQDGARDPGGRAYVPGEPVRQGPLGGVPARATSRGRPWGNRRGGAMNAAVPGRGRAGLMRDGLALLSLPALAVGVWALFLPRSFYEDFPSAGRGWVSALGPYNGHLLTDVGAMYLALGVLLALAAVSLGRELVRTSLVVWLVFAVPHFVFHAATIHHHPLPIDRAGNLISLGFVVVLPLILLYLDGSRATPARRTIEGTQRG